MFKYVFSCFFCDILQSLDLNLQWYLIVHISLLILVCPKELIPTLKSIQSLSTTTYE